MHQNVAKLHALQDAHAQNILRLTQVSDLNTRGKLTKISKFAAHTSVDTDVVNNLEVGLSTASSGQWFCSAEMSVRSPYTKHVFSLSKKRIFRWKYPKNIFIYV